MLKRNITLAHYSNYHIGGPASYFLKFHSADEFIEGFTEWRRISGNASGKYIIIGAGSNILFDDQGYDGLVAQCSITTIQPLSAETVRFGSGLLFENANHFTAEHGLSGFEWAGGLPGSLGGAIRGNAGAFGGETKDNIIYVESLDTLSGKIIHRTQEECSFSYRSSIFKTSARNEIIISADFIFSPNDSAKIAQTMDEHRSYREDRQPLNFPSAGSTFKNVPVATLPHQWQVMYQHKIKNDPFPVIPVAVLLSEAGLKGKRIGNAQISEKHPNFIVNLGRASARDVKDLITLAQQTIHAKYDVLIEPEVMVINH